MRPHRAVVTGATGGIGSAFCRALAAQGCALIISGRRQAALDALRDELERTHRVAVETIAANLSVRHELDALADRVRQSTDVDLLINNAGLIAPGPLAQSPLGPQLELIDVHAGATVRLCHAGLPAMIERRRGAIINVSSLGGFAPAPDDAVYSATKQLVIHFSRALALATAGAGIKVQALCPGFTRTNIHRAYGTEAFIPPPFWMSPVEVVDESLAALDSPHVICIPGATNRLMARIIRYPWLVRRVIGATAAISRRRGWGRT